MFGVGEQTTAEVKTDTNASNNRDAKPQSRGLRYLKFADVKFLEGSSRVHARVLHPGPSLELIDRYGHPPLAHMLRLGSTARWFAMHTAVEESGRTFFDYGKLTEGFFTFYHTSKTTISKNFYDS